MKFCLSRSQSHSKIPQRYYNNRQANVNISIQNYHILTKILSPLMQFKKFIKLSQKQLAALSVACAYGSESRFSLGSEVSTSASSAGGRLFTMMITRILDIDQLLFYKTKSAFSLNLLRVIILKKRCFLTAQDAKTDSIFKCESSPHLRFHVRYTARHKFLVHTFMTVLAINV